MGREAFTGAENLFISDMTAWCKMIWNKPFASGDPSIWLTETNLYLNNQLVTDLIIPDALKINNLYNINIPKDDKGIVYTRLGGIYFYDEFVYLGNDMYEQRGGLVESDSCDLTVDTDAIRNGYLSRTPLTHERTNLEVFQKLTSSDK